jgi:hypothetical protein
MDNGPIQCGSTAFGADVPVSQLLVTDASSLGGGTNFVSVAQIVTPTGSGHSTVCGNDIALLILARPIALPQYVTPAINPPMSDPRYSVAVTAIGYGINSPADTTGASSGVRRIHQNVALACVPNDPSFLNCYSAPQAAQVLQPNEFISGDSSACEGDSGSNAFDQASFNRNEWVSFGVLSRGGVDQDSGTCVAPIYSRFDAWAGLLVQAATQAAALGGYALPAWASAASTDAALPPGTLNTGTPVPEAAAPAPLLADGVACPADGACQSMNCVSVDTVNYYCARPCSSGACAPRFSCDQGFCFPTAPKDAAPADATNADGATASPKPTHGGGCSIGPAGGAGDGARGLSLLLIGIVAAGTHRMRSGRRGARVGLRTGPRSG